MRKRNYGFPAVIALDPESLRGRSLGILRLPGSQKNLAAGTELENFTTAAIRLTRITSAAPVPDEPVTPVSPMLAGHELHQIALDFFCVLVLRQAQPLRETDDMRVHHDAFILVEGVAQHHVCSLTSDPRQGA